MKRGSSLIFTLTILSSLLACVVFCAFWVLPDFSMRSDVQEFVAVKWQWLVDFVKKHVPALDPLWAPSSEERYLEGLLTAVESADARVMDIIVPARKVIAKILATQKELEKKLASSSQHVIRWHDRATLAVQQNNDDLAKQALGKKLFYQEEVVKLSKEIKDSKVICDSMQDILFKLDAARDLFYRKKITLAARAKAAAALSQVHRKIAAANRQAFFSHIDLQVREMENISGTELVSLSQSALKNFSNLLNGIDNEVLAMEAHVAHCNTTTKSQSSHVQEAVQRELDELKKSRDETQPDKT